MRDLCRVKAHSFLWSIYSPAIVTEGSKRVFGSHPRRVFSISYHQIVDCHGRGRGFESRRPRQFFSDSFHFVPALRSGFSVQDFGCGFR